MKKILKLISLISIFIFLALWISSKFLTDSEYNTMDIRNVLVLVHLVSNLTYYKMEVDDKDALISELKSKLSEN